MSNEGCSRHVDNYFRPSIKTTLMKMKFLAFSMLATAVAIVSCKGDKGELGPAGPNGKNSLTRTLVEAAGGNCATGGAKIETGIDANGNGTLDDGEVAATQTRYICNGATGNNTITKTTVEAAGGNCGTGGVKVEVGVDANKNGTLDASEIVTAMTRYICNGQNGTNGENGLNTLIRTTAEPSGANCTYGGVKFETGLDVNKNGTLDDSEVTTTQTKYVCNGAGVTYSRWIDVDMVDADYSDEMEVEFDYEQEIATPALTADITDKGVVLMYFKNSKGTITPVERDDVFEVIDVDAAGNYIYFNPGFVFKQGLITFLASSVYNSGTGSYDKAHINGSGSAIRYVLIPGLTEGRTVADLKKMSYEQVAKLYNIK
jgi:hypothetical protein